MAEQTGQPVFDANGYQTGGPDLSGATQAAIRAFRQAENNRVRQARLDTDSLRAAARVPATERAAYVAATDLIAATAAEQVQAIEDANPRRVVTAGRDATDDEIIAAAAAEQAAASVQLRPYLGYPVLLQPGCDYVLRTKVGAERYPRQWRLGFIGKARESSDLLFTAEGPDGADGPRYGGLVRFSRSHIIEAAAVPRIIAERHIARRATDGALGLDPQTPPAR